MRCVSGYWRVSFSIPKSEETMQKKGKKSMRWHHGFRVCLHRQELSVLLDSILSQRLSFSQKGMEVYGFSIFGQYIPMQGNGGSTETPLNYFFLDSSYISILLQYGLIMFVMILILWGIIGLRARKEKDWVLLWILAIIAFQSIMEQHLLDISYNPFLWILFAETGKKRKQKKISGAEKNI